MAITRRGLAVGIGLVVLTTFTAGHAIADGGEKGSVATAVASISWSPGPHIRVYKSDGDRVTEKAWDGSGPWQTGGLNVPGQTVTATSWLDPAIHIRVTSSMRAHSPSTAGWWRPWFKGGYRP